MTEQELQQTRKALRERGEVGEQVLDELRRVVAAVARWGLPPAFAPYGVWNEEAVEEVYQDWVADRMLQNGGLQSLLDKARSGAALRRMAERSLRQHLLNQRDRSQTQNLYPRVAHLLRDSGRFIEVLGATRQSQVWWAIRGKEERPEWDGDEDALLSAAWSLGDFAVIRYKPDASKLSPVLSADDLERFVTGLFDATGSRLTLALIARALELRFNLDRVNVDSLSDIEEEPASVGDPVDSQVAVAATARAVIAELSPRQCDVVLGARGGERQAAIGNRLGCSEGTVSNELHRIGQVVDRYSEDQDERDMLLRIVGDQLYEQWDRP
jgi:hypothetical protein